MDTVSGHDVASVQNPVFKSLDKRMEVDALLARLRSQLTASGEIDEVCYFFLSLYLHRFCLLPTLALFCCDVR